MHFVYFAQMIHYLCIMPLRTLFISIHTKSPLFNMWVFCLDVICVLCVWLITTGIRRGHRIPSNWSYRWLWTTMLVLLGVKPRPSARARSALNHWAVSAALLCYFEQSFSEDLAMFMWHDKLLDVYIYVHTYLSYNYGNVKSEYMMF